jgi:hypothetical protein
LYTKGGDCFRECGIDLVRSQRLLTLCMIPETKMVRLKPDARASIDYPDFICVSLRD